MSSVNNRMNTCCFFGHRQINETEVLKNRLYRNIERLIMNEQVDIFLFGGQSQFDDLCYRMVTELKKKYHHIKRVYVRASFPYIDDHYKNYLLQDYEDTYYPQRILNSGKAAYVERNYEMIDKSGFCIVYYDENYLPPRRKNKFADYQPKSGTKLAYDYAIRKGLIVNNVLKKGRE